MCYLRTMTQLYFRPCPNGHPPADVWTEVELNENCDPVFYAECSHCMVRTDSFGSDDDAIAAWEAGLVRKPNRAAK